MTDFNSVPEFDSDLARLSKKYPSLNSDIERLKSVLRVVHPRDLPGGVRISDLGAGVSDPVYKARHFRCESLKGKGCKSGIRVIFGHDDPTNIIKFIEIYHKSQKANHDKDRIKKYLEAS